MSQTPNKAGATVERALVGGLIGAAVAVGCLIPPVVCPDIRGYAGILGVPLDSS